MRNQWLYVYGTNSAVYQLWRYNVAEQTIYTENNKFLDIQDRKDEEGKYVRGENRAAGQTSQRWKILYLDQKSREPTKGLNKHR